MRTCTKRRLALTLGLLLVATWACRAQSDEAVVCYQSKLAVVRVGAARLLRCGVLISRGIHQQRAATCLERTSRRIHSLLDAAEATAAATGFVCPAGAESLGLEGAANWPLDLFNETVAGDFAVAPICARHRARAAAIYTSAYVLCRLGSDAEDSSEAASCAERGRKIFERAWTEAAADGCRADVPSSEVAARIESEVEADAARLRVRCGDGRREGFETCDDNAGVDGDGCDAACKTETCARVAGEVRCLACPADSELDLSVPGGPGQCRCPAGFYGDPGSCQDVDECESGEAECPEGHPCVNVPGSYSCSIPCTEAAFEEAIASCGAPTGHIAFDCHDTVIPISQTSGTHARRVDCDGLVIDGLDRNVSFEMDPLCWRLPLTAEQCSGPLEDDGTCACPDVDNGTTFLLLAGTGDVVRNIAVSGFFDGIRAEGSAARVENVRFERICDDAFGSVGSGVGNVFRHLVARNGCDKCSQNTGKIALTDPDPRLSEHYNAIFSDIDFVGCRTPIRMADAGRFRIEDVRMTPGSDGTFPCDGPRFSGSDPGELVIEMQRSEIAGCRRGVRFGRDAEGILTHNTIRSCLLRGVLASGNAMVSMSSNEIRGNGGRGSAEPGFGGVAAAGEARIDLGGGGFTLDGSAVASSGSNWLCDNFGPDVDRRDVDNGAANIVSAEDNWWCSKDSPAARITGPVDVMPYLDRAP